MTTALRDQVREMHNVPLRGKEDRDRTCLARLRGAEQRAGNQDRVRDQRGDEGGRERHSEEHRRDASSHVRRGEIPAEHNLKCGKKQLPRRSELRKGNTELHH